MNPNVGRLQALNGQFTIKEAANILGLGRSTVDRIARNHFLQMKPSCRAMSAEEVDVAVELIYRYGVSVSETARKLELSHANVQWRTTQYLLSFGAKPGARSGRN